MARTKLFQTAYTSGQLDQNLMGRLDSAKYYQGASKIENGYCIPQGGVQKRGGLEHLGVLGYDNTHYRLIPYFFGSPTGEDQSYVIVLSAGSMEVREPTGEVILNLNTPWVKESDLYEIDYVQSYDYLIFTHEDYAPQRLIRIQDTWNLDNIAFEAIPVYAFPNPLEAPSVAYDKQTLVSNSIEKGETFKLVYNGNTSSDITWTWVENYPTGPNQDTNDDASSLVSDVQNFLRGAVGNSDVTVTTNYNLQSVSFGSSGGEPLDAFWRKFSGLTVTFTGVNEGLGLLISELTARLKVTAIGGGITPAPEEEPVWSDSRGWPISVVFYENRLFFGGSRSRPSTIWGSRTGRYFDFSYENPEGDIVADDYIDVTIDTNQVNRIQSIISGRRLEIFTTGSEHYCPVEGVTPLNFPVVQTGNVGSKKVTPIQFDNTTLYAQRRGDAIRDFVYDFANDKYISNVTSSLATSLIKDAKQLVVQQGVGTAQSDYLYLLNGDGSLSVYSSDVLNGVAAWTEFTTEGEFVSLTESAGVVFAIVKRPHNGGTVTTLNVLNSTEFLDGWKRVTTTSPLVSEEGVVSKASGLLHLANQEVTIVEDLQGGVVLSKAIVDAQGEIDFSDKEVGANLIIGLPYHFEVTSMPISLNGQQGQVVYDRKRITRTILNVQDTTDFYVSYNGKERPVRNRKLPFNPLAQNPSITGYKEVFLRGYSRDTRVGVVQDAPFNFTLISMGVEVEL